MNVTFGALAKPLTEQLAGYVDEKRLNIIEKDNVAITTLNIRGLLTDAETTKARKRLLKAISATLKE